MIDTKDATYASLESLIRDREQAYRLTHQFGHRTANLVGGQYKSAFKAKGLDFSEVRGYQPGDDIRLIDWHTTAKVGKVFTKVFIEEKERQIWFLIDLRKPMRFATRQAFKSVIAAHMLAMLAWAFQEQGDKIGGVILTDTDIEVYEPSRLRRAIMAFFGAVSNGTKQTDRNNNLSLREACSKLRRACKTGHIVFVISDFHDFDDDVLKSLSSLSKDNELSLINIYDELERQSPIPDVYAVTDGKDVAALDTRSPAVRQAYADYFKTRHNQLEKFASDYHIRYIPLMTSMDAYDTVANGLHKRR